MIIRTQKGNRGVFFEVETIRDNGEIAIIRGKPLPIKHLTPQTSHIFNVHIGVDTVYVRAIAQPPEVEESEDTVYLVSESYFDWVSMRSESKPIAVVRSLAVAKAIAFKRNNDPNSGTVQIQRWTLGTAENWNLYESEDV
jgi:hypothetical protein